MTRYHKALGMILVTMFGLWGCSQGPASPSSAASSDKAKTVEAKAAKLEEDLKVAAAARDLAQRRLSDSEETIALLHQEIDRLQRVAKERDNLKSDLQARTTERDQLQAQYETFRRSIQDLLGQAETSLKTGKPLIGLAHSESSRSGPGGGN